MASEHVARHDSGPCPACKSPDEQADRINAETVARIAQRARLGGFTTEDAIRAIYDIARAALNPNEGEKG